MKLSVRRSEVFAWSLFGLLAALLFAPAARGEAPARPNILHIHADDYRADALGALGHPVVKTPNLDTLVKRGATFTRCYTQGSLVGAVCQPSRAMMLTGRSLFHIGGPRAKHCDAPLLPEVLAAAGYQTWHTGKSGNGFVPGISAFQTNMVDDARGAQSRAGACRRMANRTIKFLKSRERSKPFYIYLAPPVPHDPRAAEPQFHALYETAEIPLSPAFLPLHPFNNGDMTIRDERLAPWPRTPENTRRQLADYYACVTGLDYHVGRVLKTLEELGQLDETIVVFSGDNGLSLGEHGLFGKQNLYEFGGMHVPLVIAGPGVPRGQSDALVYLMDLFPTFCDFAGAKVPEGVEGQNLRPILAGERDRVRDVLYTAYKNCQRAARDDRWKLIRYPLVDKTQLFDLRNDPRELRNLAEKPEHAAKVAAMTALLKREMARYDDPAPLEVAHPRPAKWTPPEK